MSDVRISVVSPSPNGLGEGPYWDSQEKALYYVDIDNGDLHRLDPELKEDKKLHIGGSTSFIIRRENVPDEWIISSDLKILTVKWKTGKTEEIGHVRQSGTRLNDAKCDPEGRLWAGTMFCSTDLAKYPQHRGALYCLDSDLTLTEQVSKVTLSNGLAWSLDSSTMFYIDSIPGTLSAYAYDDLGNAGELRSVMKFDKIGLPDGMTIDQQGKLWVACYDGGKVVRIDPETEKVLQTVEFPATKTTSCCFGGPDLADLYVTSVSSQLTEQEAASQPLAGHVFKVQNLGVKGTPSIPFCA